jgi:hypothetical protein
MCQNGMTSDEKRNQTAVHSESMEWNGKLIIGRPEGRFFRSQRQKGSIYQNEILETRITKFRKNLQIVSTVYRFSNANQLPVLMGILTTLFEHAPFNNIGFPQQVHTFLNRSACIFNLNFVKTHQMPLTYQKVHLHILHGLNNVLLTKKGN